jgi:excisionase family DNA binding protein
MPRTISPPRLISTDEAAELLSVDQSTIRNWIAKDLIPYVELPGDGERKTYRIPLTGLLQSLKGTYDMASAVRELDEKQSADMSDDEILDASKQ